MLTHKMIRYHAVNILVCTLSIRLKFLLCCILFIIIYCKIMYKQNDQLVIQFEELASIKPIF